MRLEVICENRLGIAREVLDILASYNLNLRGIDADQTGRIYVHFPELEFSEFQLLMQQIRKIEGVKDVRSVPHMPSEREHYALETLLKTLPDPVFSIDTKGNITRVNEAGMSVMRLTAEELEGNLLQQWLLGFSFSKWLAQDEVLAQAVKVTIYGVEYLAEMLPIYLPDVDGSEIMAGAVVMLKSSARIGKQFNALRRNNSAGFERVLAESAAMKQVVHQAKKLAQVDAPLLIQGETGTGKEVIARACHEASLRREHPFVAINCSAIPDEVAESELFGYAPGAGGMDNGGKRGLIEQANGGTIFFDEVAEISPKQQIKLLRLLETGRFRRVGAETEVEVDIRIICSSQKDIAQLCQSGTFREDLYYRINVLSLSLAPLRDRKKDILPLAEMFLEYYSHKLSSVTHRLSSACCDQLLNYGWPGNVRQLKNAIYRAVCMVEDATELGPDHLSLPSYSDGYGYFDDSFEGTLDQATKHFEANLLRRLYPAYPSTRQLARKLGVSHTAIANKLREYGISKKKTS